MTGLIYVNTGTRVRAPGCAQMTGFRSNQKRLCVDLVHEDEWELREVFRNLSPQGNPCAPDSPNARLPRQALSRELMEDRTMPRVKQASTHVPARLGVAAFLTRGWRPRPT
jgi:hypothetical protein